MLDFSLTPAQHALIAETRAWVAQRFAPLIAARDSAGVYDPETFPSLAQAGLTGICLPTRYGGRGMDYVSLALACEELEYCDSSLRIILSVHSGLCSCGIYQWGSEQQKQRFLPPLATGHLYGAFGLTEPAAGSDVAALQTTARRDGDSYILSGQKAWISGADVADVFLIFATLDPALRHRGLACFIVERASANGALISTTIHNKAGLRAGNTGHLALHDVRVPASARLGEEGEGFKIAMSCLDNGRLTVAAGATGLIRACLDASVAYAQQRAAFGQPIGRYQLVQQMIAHMVSSYDTARLLTLRAAWLKNSGQRNTRETALAKWFATDASLAAASDAMEVHAAHGYSDDYPVARFLRNAQAGVIYEGTREMQTIIQAEYALGYRSDAPLRCPLPPYSPDNN